MLLSGMPIRSLRTLRRMNDQKNITPSGGRGTDKRSCCLRIGGFIVIQKILKYYSIPEILEDYFKPKDAGLFLDLVAYSIICESNACQYYPDFAYNHPLFSHGMHIYSDSSVSAFLNSVTVDQSVAFLNTWNASRDHREKIYISYDSTNKNCQAGDIEMVEFGYPKVNAGLPVINYSMAYDTCNRVPLFYEYYPGSIVDVSQLQIMLDKAHAYGYRHVGFILDRGYFSKGNIQFMDAKGYDFVLMVKGKKDGVFQNRPFSGNKCLKTAKKTPVCSV